MELNLAMEGIETTAHRKLLRTKSSPWKHVLNITIYLTIIFGIIVGLPRFLTWKLHTTYPMAAITSGSMWPVLKEGDLVFIEGVAREDIHIGDIIVFQNRTNNTLTIHRVVKLEEEKLTTKGDANFSEDVPAVYSDVIGRTYNIRGKPLRIPYLGSVTMFASSVKKNYEEHK